MELPPTSYDPGLPLEPFGDESVTGDTTTSLFKHKDGWLVKMKVDGKVKSFGIWPTKQQAIGVRNEVRERRANLPKARKRKPEAPNPLAAVTPVLPPETAVVPDPPPPVAPETRDMRNIKRVKDRYYVTLSICGNRPENLGVFDTYEEAVAIRDLNWVRRDKLRAQERAAKDPPRKVRVKRKNQKKKPQVVWGTIGPTAALSWGESGLSV
tara:strand:- start:1174 stop:1803 length:630 start_codon:yes stop_codon:yes gene_type:complete